MEESGHRYWAIVVLILILLFLYLMWDVIVKDAVCGTLPDKPWLCK